MVHCSAGVSRSASLVIYWMMRKYRMTLMAAYRALKTSRGCIAPNFTFWQQLVGALVCALHAVVHLDHLCRAQTPSGSAWSACVSWGRASVTRRALQMQRSSWQAWCPAASWNTKKFASWTHFLHVPAVRSLLTYLPCGGFCFFVWCVVVLCPCVVWHAVLVQLARLGCGRVRLVLGGVSSLVAQLE